MTVPTPHLSDPLRGRKSRVGSYLRAEAARGEGGCTDEAVVPDGEGEGGAASVGADLVGGDAVGDRLRSFLGCPLHGGVAAEGDGLVPAVGALEAVPGLDDPGGVGCPADVHDQLVPLLTRQRRRYCDPGRDVAVGAAGVGAAGVAAVHGVAEAGLQDERDVVGVCGQHDRGAPDVLKVELCERESPAECGGFAPVAREAHHEPVVVVASETDAALVEGFAGGVRGGRREVEASPVGFPARRSPTAR